MRLKRLEINGFKSFANRTIFDFGDGITGIVGPNGCGKTNVVDSIKWVLGEQAPRSLRSSSMSDVLFKGAGSVTASSRAEVQLHFENDGTLPVDTEEVAVGRRLYRSGESEYLLNNKAVRRKDIRELLMGTGLTATSYFILEQGKIDKVLSAAPEDRRQILDEAAGISLFKARKKETMRKLERVEDNLTRLTDIIDEVEKRVRSLKNQAGRARRFQELQSKLAQLRMANSFRRFRIVVEEIDGLAALRTEATEREVHLQESVARLRDEMVQADADLRQLDEDLGKRRAALAESNAQVEGTQSGIEANRRLLEEMQERSDKLAEEARSTRVRLDKGLLEREEILGQVNATEEELHRATKWVDEVEGKTGAASAEFRDIEGRLSTSKGEMVDLLQERSENQNRTVELSLRTKNLEARREEIVARRGEIDSGILSLHEERRSLEERDRGRRSDLGEAEEESRHSQGRLEDLEEQVAEATNKFQDEKTNLRGKQSRLEVLRDLEARMEGVDSGVQAVVHARTPEDEPRFPGLLGMVASFLKVDLKFAGALERALGPRAQSLVVETRDEALRAARFLASEKKGFAHFYPLEVFRTKPENPESVDSTSVESGSGDSQAGSDGREGGGLEPDENDDSGVGFVESVEPWSPEPDFRSDEASDHWLYARTPEWIETALQFNGVPALDLVRENVDSRVLPVLRRLLSEIRFVSTKEAAHRLVKSKGFPGIRFVALDGTVVEPDGSFSSGQKGRLPGLIAQKNEIEILERDISVLEVELEELGSRRVRIQEEIGPTKQVIAEKEQLVRECEKHLIQIRSELTELARREAALKEERFVDETDEKELARELSELQGRQSEEAGVAERLAGSIDTLRGLIEEMEKQRSVQEECLEQLRKQANEARVHLAGIAEKGQSLRSSLEMLDRVVGEERRRIETADEEIEALKIKCERTQAEGGKLADRLVELERGREAVQVELTSDQEKRSRFVEAREKMQLGREELEQELFSSRQTLGELEIRLSELTANRTNLIERVREDLDLDLSEEYATYLDKKRAKETPSSEDEAVTEASAEVVSWDGDRADGDQEATEQQPAEATSTREEGADPEAAESKDEESKDEESEEEAADEFCPFEFEEGVDFEAQIEDLRSKLERIGNVNLEALDELKDQEDRSTYLDGQRRDLVSSKNKLIEVIERIDKDSESKFVETFKEVRVHFNEIFRKLFGGGKADLVLLNEEDPLDCGIEVVARPPGKELVSLSQLSGGERTMTAVGILFAIFKSRPSPFCLLDEVDAALDDANIQRFVDMLRHYLTESQFIIVTHSKRTMSVTDRLYGVTMERSGVSKRIAVQFSGREVVLENGEVVPTDDGKKSSSASGDDSAPGENLGGSGEDDSEEDLASSLGERTASSEEDPEPEEGDEGSDDPTPPPSSRRRSRRQVTLEEQLDGAPLGANGGVTSGSEEGEEARSAQPAVEVLAAPEAVSERSLTQMGTETLSARSDAPAEARTEPVSGPGPEGLSSPASVLRPEPRGTESEGPRTLSGTGGGDGAPPSGDLGL